MSNVFYDAGTARADKVNDLFARIARRYDLINDLQSFGLHRSWKRRVVDLAAVRTDARALDVCCGTGDIAAALAQRGAVTTGLDFSPQMLAVAAERQKKIPNSQFRISSRVTPSNCHFPTTPSTL